MHEVRLANDADAPEVGRVFAAGFREDPVMCWVFSEPDRTRKITNLFTFLAHESLVPLGATWVLPGSAAGWQPPGEREPSPERAERFEAAMALATEADGERLSHFGAEAEARRPAEPHWHLSVLASDDEARGKGQGARLLVESLRRIDADGLPAHLESTNTRNVPLYLRHGFEVVEEVRLPDGPIFTVMVRPPVSG